MGDEKKNKIKKTEKAVTNDDESGSLEELLVVPRGMICFQDVTHSVVLPQPYGGVHTKTRQRTKHVVTNGQLLVSGEVWGILHVHRDIRYRRGVHLAVY